MSQNFSLYRESMRDYSYGLSLTSIGRSSLVLYDEGCWVNGIRDCEVMCSDSDLMWGANKQFNLSVSANVANCVRYLSIAKILQDAAKNDTIVVKNREIADDFGIRELSADSYERVNDTAFGCIVDFCKLRPDQCARYNGTTTVSALFDIYDTGPSWYVPYYPYVCHNMKIPLNPDLAGIGILSAYIIAGAILVLCYASLRFLDNWLVYVSTPVNWLNKNINFQQAVARAQTSQAKIAKTHYRGVLVATLADFQKSQCIFWLAIDVAALVGLKSAKTLGARSLSEFGVTTSTIGTVCLAGLIFVTFGLYCLHMAGKRSWYILSVSMLTSIMNVAVYSTIRIASPNRLAPDPAEGYTACGNFSPQTYCDYRSTNYDYYLVGWLRSRSLYLAMFITAGMMNFGLIVEMLVRDTNISQHAIFKTLREYISILDRLPKFIRNAGLWRVLVELVFLLWLGLTFVNIIMIYYVGGGREANLNVWTFGQIIALTIWAPVFLEANYATIHGLDKASLHRIAWPYKLIRADRHANNSTYKMTPLDTHDDDDEVQNGFHRQHTDIEHRVSVHERSESPSSVASSDRVPLVLTDTSPSHAERETRSVHFQNQRDESTASGADSGSISRRTTFENVSLFDNH